jgi:arsenite/tail-anchored protein-transporting ATPase
MPRVVLVTGKGGVGKTTTAAAAAVSAARAGRRTPVVSTDAAHSLGDALDVELATAASWRDSTEVEPGLHALAVGAQTVVEADWQVVRGYLLEVLDAMGVDPVVADELSALPGAEEIIALVALAHQAESGAWDLVLVDCAPTAETLRLLALPEVLGWHLDRLLPAQRRLLTALRPAASAASGVPVPGPEVVGVLLAWKELMGRVRALLTSPRASVRLVVTPERVVVAESRRVLTSLSLYGYAVDAVVVNRLVPPVPSGSGPDPWRSAWWQAQQEGMERVRESFDGIALLRAPHTAAEPVGVGALADLAAATSPDPAGPAVPDLLADVEAVRTRVEPDGEDFVLRLPLPLASAGEVAMARRDDDLVIEVGDHRRVVTLPSVLRRCVVQNAEIGRGELRVRFERDAEVWAGGR